MTLNCKGKLIDLTVPKIMGILNVTPDSFFDGGKYQSQIEIRSQVEKLLSDGADFIDIGAYSSKPNANFVSEGEELSRIIPVLSELIKTFPDALFSIDTFRSNVAKACIDLGAAMINDISAGSLDDEMLKTVATLQVPYVMMHMRGTPQTMQTHTDYNDIVKEMLFYFSQKISQARELGINDLIIDPGFGFAKTLDQNYDVFQKLELFDIGIPILVGISRKSMIYKSLNTSIEESINGTTVLNTIALTKGAKILRVHDVKEAVECVKLHQLTINN